MSGRRSASSRGRFVVAACSVLLAVAAAVGLTAASPASASELVTDYPTVAVRPGDTASFEVRVLSAQREQIDLTVTEAPPGWVARILGAGREVGSVTADPDSDTAPTLDVEIDVPVDAAPGTYAVTLAGSGPSGPTALTLRLSVTELAAAPFELSADFPELSGGPDQTFTFNVDVANNTGREAIFAINATGPSGWQVSARPSGQSQATTLTITGGSQGTLQVTATPAPDTTEGRYPINVEIVADGVPVSGEFTAVVVGTPRMVLVPAEERLSLSGSSGTTSSFELTVANDGTAPLNGVTFTGSGPTDWEVSFEPESIDVVAPGESVPVVARVRPPNGAVAGDYAITVRAAADGANESLDLRFQVETSTWWGFIAVGLIVVALASLSFIFRRFGRR